jgi:predicted transcriptional regulator
LEIAMRYPVSMTDKQAVLDALERLPEGASLEEITEELRIMASIRRGRADIAAGRSKSHEEVERLVESWATAWTSR